MVTRTIQAHLNKTSTPIAGSGHNTAPTKENHTPQKRFINNTFKEKKRKPEKRIIPNVSI
jgi:hypothetical protein